MGLLLTHGLSSHSLIDVYGHHKGHEEKVTRNLEYETTALWKHWQRCEALQELARHQHMKYESPLKCCSRD
jgi:hypothetical protein